MNASWKHRRAAFTRTELLVVLAMTVLLALVLPAVIHRGHRPRSRISCHNNLKQIGIAFRLWAGDNGDRFPMHVSTNEGGAMEWALQGDAFRVFQVMSNELNTPKIVVCPQDRQVIAYSFGPTLPPGAVGSPFTGNSNVSYFVGLDASGTNTSSWLSGDATLMAGSKTALAPGLWAVTNGQLSGWTPKRHGGLGNLCSGDGTVQQLRQPPWPANSPATIRLVIP